MGIATRSKTGATPPRPAPGVTKARSAKITKVTKDAVAAVKDAVAVGKDVLGGKAGPRKATGKKGAKAAAAPVVPAGFGGAVGQRFPILDLVDDSGTTVSTGSLISAAGGLVVFTYPKANTGGCTTQACGFRDVGAELASFGYTVFGASYDSVKSQSSWKAKHSLSFPLLCDKLDVGLVKALGCHKAPKSVARAVFVVRNNDEGVPCVVLSQIGVKPKDSVEMAMTYARENSLGAKEAGANGEGATNDEKKGGDAPKSEAPVKDGEKAEDVTGGDASAAADKAATEQKGSAPPATN